VGLTAAVRAFAFGSKKVARRCADRPSGDRVPTRINGGRVFAREARPQVRGWKLPAKVIEPQREVWRNITGAPGV
jgi:hypothetical protein